MLIDTITVNTGEVIKSDTLRLSTTQDIHIDIESASELANSLNCIEEIY